jgi:hypothetical protein
MEETIIYGCAGAISAEEVHVGGEIGPVVCNSADDPTSLSRTTDDATEAPAESPTVGQHEAFDHIDSSDSRPRIPGGNNDGASLNDSGGSSVTTGSRPGEQSGSCSHYNVLLVNSDSSSLTVYPSMPPSVCASAGMRTNSFAFPVAMLTEASPELLSLPGKDDDAADDAGDDKKGDAYDESDKNADAGMADRRAVASYRNWARCESCGKWRRLVDGANTSMLPEHWFCALNLDPAHNRCSAEQEKTPKEVDEEVRRVPVLCIMPRSCVIWRVRPRVSL